MILSLSDLSEADANWWLGLSEIVLLASAIVLAIGIVGEWPDSPSWRKRRSYKLAKLAVILGVVGELIGDAGIFESSARLAVLQQAAIEQANTKAATAEEHAANLMKENVELERAIAPRRIDQGELARAVSALPRIPIFIISLNREEPEEIAQDLSFALRSIKIDDMPQWSVTRLPSEGWSREGIVAEYVHERTSGIDDSSERVAVAICRSLKSQGLMINTDKFFGPKFRADWPQSTVPTNAVLIRIGAKPLHFWENKLRREKGMGDVPEYSFCTAEEFFEWGRQERLTRQRQGSPP